MLFTLCGGASLSCSDTPGPLCRLVVKGRGGIGRGSPPGAVARAWRAKWRTSARERVHIAGWTTNLRGSGKETDHVISDGGT